LFWRSIIFVTFAHISYFYLLFALMQKVTKKSRQNNASARHFDMLSASLPKTKQCTASGGQNRNHIAQPNPIFCFVTQAPLQHC
jgi:hypothetical protein